MGKEIVRKSTISKYLCFYFLHKSIENIHAITTLSSFLKIECIPSCHSNQYCWIAAIWEDWNEKKTKVKEKWNLSELQQRSHCPHTSMQNQPESDLWRNTILRWREKKRRKQPNYESKRDWPVKKHNERKKTKKKLSKTKPEECDIKEKKLLCYIQATVNGDFSGYTSNCLPHPWPVCKRSKYLSIPKPIPYLCIHFLCAIKIVWK